MWGFYELCVIHAMVQGMRMGEGRSWLGIGCEVLMSMGADADGRWIRWWRHDDGW